MVGGSCGITALYPRSASSAAPTTSTVIPAEAKAVIHRLAVIPAQAGIHQGASRGPSPVGSAQCKFQIGRSAAKWIPACAGMTVNGLGAALHRRYNRHIAAVYMSI